eukprot:scaffold644_cov353-Prasinococcus_capsulatus_cf.AAC.7
MHGISIPFCSRHIAPRNAQPLTGPVRQRVPGAPSHTCRQDRLRLLSVRAMTLAKSPSLELGLGLGADDKAATMNEEAGSATQPHEKAKPDSSPVVPAVTQQPALPAETYHKLAADAEKYRKEAIVIEEEFKKKTQEAAEQPIPLEDDFDDSTDSSKGQSVEDDDPEKESGEPNAAKRRKLGADPGADIGDKEEVSADGEGQASAKPKSTSSPRAAEQLQADVPVPGRVLHIKGGKRDRHDSTDVAGLASLAQFKKEGETKKEHLSSAAVAEKQRRDRLNELLRDLRMLIPGAQRCDKARLIEVTVRFLSGLIARKLHLVTGLEGKVGWLESHLGIASTSQEPASSETFRALVQVSANVLKSDTTTVTMSATSVAEGLRTSNMIGTKPASLSTAALCEKARRDRYNDLLGKLRDLVPGTRFKDKCTLVEMAILFIRQQLQDIEILSQRLTAPLHVSGDGDMKVALVEELRLTRQTIQTCKEGLQIHDSYIVDGQVQDMKPSCLVPVGEMSKPALAEAKNQEGKPTLAQQQQQMPVQPSLPQATPTFAQPQLASPASLALAATALAQASQSAMSKLPTSLLSSQPLQQPGQVASTAMPIQAFEDMQQKTVGGLQLDEWMYAQKAHQMGAPQDQLKQLQQQLGLSVLQPLAGGFPGLAPAGQQGLPPANLPPALASQLALQQGVISKQALDTAVSAMAQQPNSILQQQLPGLQLSLQTNSLPTARNATTVAAVPAGLDQAAASSMVVSAKTLARLHELIPEAKSKPAEETMLDVVEYIQRLKNKVVELTINGRDMPQGEAPGFKAASSLALNDHAAKQQQAAMAAAMGAAALSLDTSARNERILRDAAELSLNRNASASPVGGFAST